MFVFGVLSLSSAVLSMPSAAPNLRVVDVLLGDRAPDRARIRPDDVCVTVTIGVNGRF